MQSKMFLETKDRSLQSLTIERAREFGTIIDCAGNGMIDSRTYPTLPSKR